jgi:spermidine/putrescine transport system substrate-binding protein
MATENSLSPEARSILGSRISRRAVLAGAGGLGAAGLLAACGSGGDSASAESTVRWGNWPLYLDFDEETKTYPTLVKFTEETGIEAKYF